MRKKWDGKKIGFGRLTAKACCSRMARQRTGAAEHRRAAGHPLSGQRDRHVFARTRAEDGGGGIWRYSRPRRNVPGIQREGGSRVRSTSARTAQVEHLENRGGA